MLKTGDVILELSNLNRELTVSAAGSVAQRNINRNRETRLGIMKNDLEQTDPGTDR